MGPLWCWRCKREVLMLDEEEYQRVFMLFNTGMVTEENVSLAP